MISRRVVPMGTSTSPVLFTLPTSEKILVPLLPAVPILLYHAEPLVMIRGTLAQVSTLFRLDGLPYSPFSEVWTYLARGSPPFPSREAISAVDSPQMKAPPPRLTFTCKMNPAPRLSPPHSPDLSH